MKKNYKILLMTVILGCLCMMTSMKSQAASGNKSWKSVYADANIQGNSFVYYVKYGKLKIARNNGTLYLKKNGSKYQIRINKVYMGGVLTNGRKILYQYGGNIYQWENARKEKVCTIKSSDILVGRYGNTIYFGRNIDYDVYQLYRYNIRTKQQVKMDYINAYYCNGKYLVVGGQFHEGTSTTLKLLNMKNGKITVVSKKCAYGNAVIISGTELYYMEYNDKKSTCKYKCINLKTGKKKTLKTNIIPCYGILDKYHYYYMQDDDGIFIYDVQKKQEYLY